MTTRRLWIVGVVLVVSLGLAAFVTWWQLRAGAPEARAGRVVSMSSGVLQLASSTQTYEVRIGPDTVVRSLDQAGNFRSLARDDVRVGEYVVVSKAGSTPTDPVAQLDVFSTFPVAEVP